MFSHLPGKKNNKKVGIQHEEKLDAPNPARKPTAGKRSAELVTLVQPAVPTLSRQRNVGEGWSRIHPVPGTVRPCSGTTPLPTGGFRSAAACPDLKTGGGKTKDPSRFPVPASPGREHTQLPSQKAGARCHEGLRDLFPAFLLSCMTPIAPQKRKISHFYPTWATREEFPPSRLVLTPAITELSLAVTHPWPGKAPTARRLKQKLMFLGCFFFLPHKTLFYSKKMPLESH